MIKKTNATLQTKLLGIKSKETIHKLILTLGYVDIDEEHYIFLGDYFTVLMLGQGISEHALSRLRAKYMTPEEHKRWELAEQKRLEALEEMKAK